VKNHFILIITGINITRFTAEKCVILTVLNFAFMPIDGQVSMVTNL